MVGADGRARDDSRTCNGWIRYQSYQSTPQGSGMQCPRVRFTVRALAIVVAVAALLTGGFVLASRAAHYRREALYHSRAAARAAGEARLP